MQCFEEISFFTVRRGLAEPFGIGYFRVPCTVDALAFSTRRLSAGAHPPPTPDPILRYEREHATNLLKPSLRPALPPGGPPLHASPDDVLVPRARVDRVDHLDTRAAHHSRHVRPG